MEMFYVLAAVVFLGIVWTISVHNRAVRLRQNVRESWSNIDVQLKRRHDLIPNLVAVAKGYAAHERELFERIANARVQTMASMGHVKDVASAERGLVDAVNVLMARVEDYPELKASVQFLALQEELVLTEDRIAAARRFYNGNVRDLNTLIECFPASLLIGSQAKADFFEVDEISVRAPITVNLT